MKIITCSMSVSCEHEGPGDGDVGVLVEPPPQPCIASSASSDIPAAVPNFSRSRRFICTRLTKRIRVTSSVYAISPRPPPPYNSSRVGRRVSSVGWIAHLNRQFGKLNPFEEHFASPGFLDGP